MACSAPTKWIAGAATLVGLLAAGPGAAQIAGSASVGTWSLSGSVGVGTRAATDREYWIEASAERLVSAALTIRLSASTWFASVGCASGVCHPGSGWNLGPTLLLGAGPRTTVRPYVGAGLHLVDLDRLRAGSVVLAGFAISPGGSLGLRGELAYRRNLGAPSPDVIVGMFGARVSLPSR